MQNPFRDGVVKNDVVRYEITLGMLPEKLEGWALDIGVMNPFTKTLIHHYPDLRIVNTDKNNDFDVDRLCYTNDAFDVVFHFEVIEHLINQLHNMAECSRVLKSQGRMFLTTPAGVFPSSMWLPTHFHELDERKLRMLLTRAGFSIVRLEKFNKPFSFWLRMGLFRPMLRWMFGGWYFVEAVKAG